MIILLTVIVLIAIVYIVTRKLVTTSISPSRTTSYAFLIIIAILFSGYGVESAFVKQHNNLKDEKTTLMAEYNYALNTKGDIIAVKKKISDHNRECEKFYDNYQKDWWVDLILYNRESSKEYIINM